MKNTKIDRNALFWLAVDFDKNESRARNVIETGKGDGAKVGRASTEG
jgi:hypothetical protein